MVNGCDELLRRVQCLLRALTSGPRVPQHCKGTAEELDLVKAALEPWGDVWEKAAAGSFDGHALEPGQQTINLGQVSSETANAKLVEFLACCGASFRLTEHPAFREYIAAVAGCGRNYKCVSAAASAADASV